ncbi:DUF5089 domain-containing protein [Hymenobacter sp. J193]|uniref:DUF5089 domain-containing protein n=1 Tax=Hymenobacter sp. J193 TaxID=2898429 RepID=UPI00215120A2|nr:DUF5089 domain-containing protein [Hymenobacter sp. J193]MCR5887553.1 DUF5089 domain-containing protein [Hymenobacter sp. J193]
MKQENQKKKTKKPAKLTSVPRLQRPSVIKEAFLSFPATTPYVERVKALAIHFKTSEKNIYQTAQRHKFKQQLEAIAITQKQQEELERVLDSAAPIRQEIPSSQLARQIKDVAFVLLTTGQKAVRTASVMIEYYSHLIQSKIASVGGFSYLTEADLKQIQAWQAQVNYYTKSIGEWLKPGAITSLLESINFKQGLPLDLEEIETGHFTPARLQQTLLSMGLPTAFQLAQGQLPATTETQLPPFAPYTELPELPALDAWSNGG